MANEKPDRFIQTIKDQCKKIKKYQVADLTLMQIQHRVANVLGFTKWADLLENIKNNQIHGLHLKIEKLKGAVNLLKQDYELNKTKNKCQKCGSLETVKTVGLHPKNTKIITIMCKKCNFITQKEI